MTETERKLVNLLAVGVVLMVVVFVEGQESGVRRLDQLVPTIKQDNYVLVPIENKYYLNLDFPDGGRREENVELLTDENGKKVLTVKGTLNLVYEDTPLQVVVIYEADGHGYRARYMYAPKLTGIPAVLQASASLLKSAAG